METLVQIQNLSRYYGELCAVRDISFELRRGDILGFLGPNGAGKSTTMQMISGVLAPSAGAIALNGIDLLGEPRRAKRHLGFLPETPPLYVDHTVGEYLAYCARLRGLRGRSVKPAVMQACERCGLGEVGKRLIASLSKGFRQRVGIAQAILHTPDIIILDEPTSGLDPNQIREIRDLIAELGSEHAIILSTHILAEVQHTCNRVQIIHRGELVLEDDIDGLQSRMQSQGFVLSFASPPALDELNALEGVRECTRLEDGRFRVTIDNEQDPRPLLVEASVTRGWGLLELWPQRRSLEEIFVELTEDGDTARTGATAA